MSGIKYMILGGGGSFAIHTALNLVGTKPSSSSDSMSQSIMFRG